MGNTVATCHTSIGQTSCAFPEVKIGCCEVLEATFECHAKIGKAAQQACMRGKMPTLFPAIMAVGGKCPGLERLKSKADAEQFCTGGLPGSYEDFTFTDALSLAAPPAPQDAVALAGDPCPGGCTTVATCHTSIGPTSCAFPEVKIGCCEVLEATFECHAKIGKAAQQACMRGKMPTLFPAIMAVGGKCPGLERLKSKADAEQFCTGGLPDSYEDFTYTDALSLAAPPAPQPT